METTQLVSGRVVTWTTGSQRPNPGKRCSPDTPRGDSVGPSLPGVWQGLESSISPCTWLE